MKVAIRIASTLLALLVFSLYLLGLAGGAIAALGGATLIAAKLDLSVVDVIVLGACAFWGVDVADRVLSTVLAWHRDHLERRIAWLRVVREHKRAQANPTWFDYPPCEGRFDMRLDDGRQDTFAGLGGRQRARVRRHANGDLYIGDVPAQRFAQDGWKFAGPI